MLYIKNWGILFNYLFWAWTTIMHSSFKLKRFKKYIKISTMKIVIYFKNIQLKLHNGNIKNYTSPNIQKFIYIFIKCWTKNSVRNKYSTKHRWILYLKSLESLIHAQEFYIQLLLPPNHLYINNLSLCLIKTGLIQTEAWIL